MLYSLLRCKGITVLKCLTANIGTRNLTGYPDLTRVMHAHPSLYAPGHRGTIAGLSFGPMGNRGTKEPGHMGHLFSSNPGHPPHGKEANNPNNNTENRPPGDQKNPFSFWGVCAHRRLEPNTYGYLTFFYYLCSYEQRINNEKWARDKSKT